MSNKTITLDGSEVKVEFYGTNAWLRNDGTSTIYAGKQPGVVSGADGVVSVPAGGSAPVYDAHGTVYLIGTGSVQLIGSDYSENPFKSSAQGGSGADEVARAAIEAHAANADIHLTTEQLNTAVNEATEGGKTVEKAAAYTLDNAVDYPLVDMRIYGKSTQDGTPTPENPVEVVSVESPTITVSNGTDSISAFLPYTLQGVPVTESGNYTDSNGQQWICDELIYNADGTGKIVKRTNEMTLDGSDDENLSLVVTVGDTMKKRLKFNPPPNIVPLNDINKYNSKSPSRVICDKYDSATTSETWNRTKDGISVSHGDNSGAIHVYNEAYSEATLDEWKSYLAANPITFVYVLNTPQELDLTAEEMTALKALQTFDGITNISNDSGAEMCVKYCTNSALSEYVKPIKTGLQKQIDELKTAVLSLGGNV